MRDYAGLYSQLLLDLELYGASAQGFYTSDQDLKSVLASSLLTSFYKKLAPKGNSPEADKAALASFIGTNDRIGSHKVSTLRQCEIDDLLWDYFRDNFRQVVDYEPEGHNLDLEGFTESLSVGPGASIGNTATNFYSKMFDSPLSATNTFIIAQYRAAILSSDTWTAAEYQRSQKFGFEMVEGNRLFFVKKNSDISRTCCTEPGVNSIVQRWIGDFLERRLKRHFGISLDSQPDVNRELARKGSIDQSFGTIDLKSASDSMSWSILCDITPPNLLGWLRHARSPKATLPGGSTVDLQMISTMGNAFTFPLQTIMFACVVKAAYQLKAIKLKLVGEPNFAVFGDDIVVCREAYPSVVRLLQLLGFIVNEGKSFNAGPFRESCGFDWFHGTQCRGVYIETLESPSDVYSAINRLGRWSAVSGIPLFRTIERLASWVRFLPIPWSADDGEGIKVPLRCLSDVGRRHGCYLYRKFTVIPNRRQVPRGPVESGNSGFHSYNQDGWLLALLGGFATSGERHFISSRDSDPGYDTGAPIWLTERLPQGVSPLRRHTVGLIPFWDYFSDTDERFPASSWEDWKVFLGLAFQR
jgi:hypothetical protein